MDWFQLLVRNNCAAPLLWRRCSRCQTSASSCGRRAGSSSRANPAAPPRCATLRRAAAAAAVAAATTYDLLCFIPAAAPPSNAAGTFACACLQGLPAQQQVQRPSRPQSRFHSDLTLHASTDQHSSHLALLMGRSRGTRRP